MMTTARLLHAHTRRLQANKLTALQAAAAVVAEPSCRVTLQRPLFSYSVAATSNNTFAIQIHWHAGASLLNPDVTHGSRD